MSYVMAHALNEPPHVDPPRLTTVPATATTRPEDALEVARGHQ